MNSSSPRVVVVGCGGIARAHLSAIAPAHIVALCDSDLNAAHRLRAEFELTSPVFDSLEIALETQPSDVAIICTPPATHFELVRLALNTGVNVLCEKPLALSVHDSSILIEVARENDVTLRTSAKYRFCAGVAGAKSLLDSGETGALQNLRIAFGSAFDFARSWHANIALSGGGVWMDNGPHALDLARYFVGDLHIESLNDWQSNGELETEGEVRLRSNAGVCVEIALSWARSLGDYFAILECERGILEIGWRETLWRPHNAQARSIAGRYDKAECFAAQWQGFLNDDARLGNEDGARAVELIEAIYRTAKASNPCCLPVA
ncbi:myo-inositol 2-dehydrogenase [Abditibacteriota bacterium]|nr:myo-inositol 2-dehydrogenase [Abditibacteriota bacterium]